MLHFQNAPCYLNWMYGRYVKISNYIYMDTIIYVFPVFTDKILWTT